MSKNLFEWNIKQEVVRSALWTRVRGKIYRESAKAEKRNYLTGYSLNLVGCLRLVVLISVLISAPCGIQV